MPAPDATGWAEIVQALAWAGATVTAAIGVAGFFITQAQSRHQRKLEIAQRRQANKAAEQALEWSRAQAAWFAIGKLESDKLAYDAMLMLDWSDRKFPSDPAAPKRDQLSEGELLRALRLAKKGDSKERFTRLEVYVRDAFDRLFWHFEWIQSQIDADLIRLAHVRFPFAYLVAQMDDNRETFDAFLTYYDYSGTLKLMRALREAGLPPVAHADSERAAPPATPAAEPKARKPATPKNKR